MGCCSSALLNDPRVIDAFALVVRAAVAARHRVTKLANEGRRRAPGLHGDLGCTRGDVTAMFRGFRGRVRNNLAGGPG